MGLRTFHWVVVLCSGLLWGCSSVKEELKPVPLQAIDAKLKLNQVWYKQVGAGQDARYARLQPAFVNGNLYTVDVYGKVVATVAKTGKRLWTTNLERDIGGGVGIGGETGFVGTLDGHIMAFNLSDGLVKWQAKTSSEVVSAPQGNDEVVVAASIDGRVQAFDVATGEEIWSYDHAVPVLSLRSTADPLVNDTYAFVAFDNGQMLSFDLRTGQMKWSVRIAQPQGKTELERLVDADTSPKAYGPYIYAASYNGRLVAVATGTGRISWTQDLSTFHHLVISDDVVVVVDSKSHVIGVDATTGSLLWTNDQLHRRGLSAPGVIGSAVFTVDQEGFVHGLKLDDGQLIARSRAGKQPVYAQPIARDGQLYIYNATGELSAYTIEQGDFSGSVWDIPTDRERGAIPTKPSGVMK